MIFAGGDSLAENYNDYGDYSEELVYQSKSKLGKFFSWRTLKTILKTIGVLLILFVYGILFFRLCSGKPPKNLSKLIWTEQMLAAYTESGGSMTIYSQEPAEHVAQDGYFGIYDIRYIPATNELQLTVRYNNSSRDKLYDELYEKETEARKAEILARLKEENPEASNTALEALVEAEYEASVEENPIEIALSEQPFVFILRDNYGKVYTSYSYLSDEKNVYQYLRIVFENVDLFGDEKTSPSHAYPVPEVNNPSDIYKGANAAKGNEITYLYLDMYYENDVNFNSETFAYPLLVYRSTSELENYTYKKEVSSVVTEGLTHIDVKETSTQN
jgi:hypothetical protein